MNRQADTPSNGPAILVLGCGHWGNPNLDMLNIHYDDMLAPQRQREIRECLDRLGRFHPTKVALEVMTDHTDELNEAYRQYLAGALRLTASERHQLGFRLAADLGHDRIFAVDWHDLDRAIGWESAFDFARDHDQLALIGSAATPQPEIERSMEEANARRRALSVREMLLELNDPANVRRSHECYANLMRVGDGDCYVGADVVCRWYERNMKIFVNLTRIAAAADRILLIIGAGHVYLLEHFIASSDLFALEPVKPYLRTED